MMAMRMMLAALAALMLASPAAAWRAPVRMAGALDRRNVIRTLSTSILGGAALAPLVAQAADAMLASPFIGNYADPNHPRGFRTIAVEGDKATLTGKDEPDADEWVLKGKISGNKIFVDFRPKGGPADLVGEYKVLPAPSGIVWPDGNKWTKKDKPAEAKRERHGDAHGRRRGCRARESHSINDAHFVLPSSMLCEHMLTERQMPSPQVFNPVPLPTP
eukprot:CAMPEP_0118875900 /NCGR_PEP_ID=MMETSP1163-20130328/16804_1 /TAXON_ID=124430 /ORGANISM="Phaeomonas parva, Strain CCMP2877" /LENGTH=217 /DNA_ID=CAMNT_0006811453 /DNA_START=30 /DNA_END=680 /DNA_ORIENTATION=+